jgi:hypothetical protein
MNMPLQDKPPVPTCEEVIPFGSPGMWSTLYDFVLLAIKKQGI